MRNLKTNTTLAGALALLLLVTAAPAAFSQEEEVQPDRPMGEKHMHGQHHGEMGEMPEGHAEKMAKHQEMMAEHKAAMKAHMATMDELVAEMNAASGDAKVDAVAAVLNEMWTHRQSMREQMGGMGKMGMGKMGGHGMMAGHPAGCPCPMHAGGECPMMKEKTEGGSMAPEDE